MNSYTRNMNLEAEERKNSAGAKKKIGMLAVGISTLILLIFFAISAQMHLRAEIERLNKRAMVIQSEIGQLNVQYTNLRNRKEKLTRWQNVSSQIQRYRLGLRDADHRQISYITIQPPRGISKELRPVVSQNMEKRPAEYASTGR